MLTVSVVLVDAGSFIENPFLVSSSPIMWGFSGRVQGGCLRYIRLDQFTMILHTVIVAYVEAPARANLTGTSNLLNRESSGLLAKVQEHKRQKLESPNDC